MAMNSISAQSRYPLQTVFKGDSVVILTKKQADGINVVFEKQTQEIQQLKLEKQHVIHLNDSLNAFYIAYTNFYAEKLKRLDLLENLIYWSAISGTWLYYSYTDSTIKAVDLSYYYTSLDDRTGDLLFINTPEEYRDTRISDNKENPPVNWEYRLREAIRPRVYNFTK